MVCSQAGASCTCECAVVIASETLVLSEKKIIIKRRAGKKYDGGVEVVRGVMLIILNS